jgi:hypothetical protein
MAVHQLFEDFKKDHHSIRRECCVFLLFSNIVLDLLFLSLQLSMDLSLFQKLSPGFQFYAFHLRTFFYGVELEAPRSNPNMDDQVIHFCLGHQL